MPASETQQDPSSAALLAASKPLLQWLNTILTETGRSSNDPSTRTANGHAVGRDSSWRRDKSSHAQVREDFRSSSNSSSSNQRASGSSLLGLYALAVAHEQELGRSDNGSTSQLNGSRGPLSEAEGLAAMRALVNALHQQDPAQQQQQQQQREDSTSEEVSLLGSLYAYAALETATAAAAAAQRPPSSTQQQEQEELAHFSSYHRALSGLSDLAEQEQSANQPHSRPHSSSRSQDHSSQDHAAVYGLLSNLQRSSSSSPHGAPRHRQAAAAGQHQHQHQQDSLAVLQLLAGLQGSPWRRQQQQQQQQQR
jgi:hypothetical protein